MGVHELFTQVPLDDIEGLQPALDSKVNASEKDQNYGFAGLSASGKLAGSQQLYSSTATIEPTGDAASGGSANSAARGDHVHPIGAHAESHAEGGSDPLTPAAIGAAADDHVHESAASGGYTVGIVPSGQTLVTLTHDLGSQDVFVMVRDVTTGWTPVAFRPLSDTSVELTFSVAPTANQYRYMIIGSAPVESASAHTHDASTLTGTVDPARLPRVLNPVTPGTVASSLTSNANSGGSIRDVTVTGASITVGAPTNPANRQILRYAFYAQVTTVVNFSASIRLSTGLTSRVFNVPQNQVLLVAMEYSSLISAWIITAATVSVS